MGDELSISILIDRTLGLSTQRQVCRGATVHDLALQLAKEDPLGDLRAAELSFCLPSSGPARPLDSQEKLTEAHLELELCDAAAPARPLPTASVFAVSDTHCEAKHNMTWLEELPSQPEDIVILAGDVAVDIVQLERALSHFLEKFKHVFYCFGNHECWLNKVHGYKDSFAKIEAIRSLCNKLGVRTTSAFVEGFWIVPIFGWYHNSWDTEPPLRPPPGVKMKRQPRAPENMSNDYQYCRWDNLENGSDALAERVDSENEAWGSWPLPPELVAEAQRAPEHRTHPIISFSHFLPRMELHVEKRFSMEPELAKLIGSSWIRSRVEQLRPDLHIFGHTHMCWDMTLDGIRYRSWPLGMPDERHWRIQNYPRSPSNLPLCMWGRDGQQTPQEDVCFGSRVYELLDRDPSSCVMGHRVANKFCPGAPVLFDDVLFPGRRYAWVPPEDKEELQRVTEAAMRLQELKRKDPPIYPEWEVVGGEDRGGILVREGRDLSSPKLPERLSTGAVVEELARHGDRIMYRRILGTGPEMGWVATELPDKELLVPRPMPPKPGDLSAKAILELQEKLLLRLGRPEFKNKLRELHLRFKGKHRTLEPFAQRRRDLLQPEFDAVLPAYGFTKGNMMQLEVYTLPLLNLVTGNVMVKENRRKLDELMMLNVSWDV